MKSDNFFHNSTFTLLFKILMYNKSENYLLQLQMDFNEENFNEENFNEENHDGENNEKDNDYDEDDEEHQYNELNIENGMAKKSNVTSKKHKKHLVVREDKYNYEIKMKDLRKQTCQKIKECLSTFGALPLGLCTFDESIEKSIFNLCVCSFSKEQCGGKRMVKSQLEDTLFKKEYANKAYEVLTILKNKNEDNILSKIKDDKLGIRSCEFKEEYINDSKDVFYLTHQFKVLEGIYECVKCHNKKIFMTQKQTRSADEPMNIFLFCITCRNRWKM